MENRKIAKTHTEKGLESLSKQLIDLTTEEEGIFLTDISAEVEKICMFYRYDIPTYVLKIVSENIFSFSTRLTRKEVRNIILAYYNEPIVNFFSGAILVNYVKTKVQELELNKIEIKKKKEQEDYYARLESIKELTPEQEAERIRKRDEFFQHVDKIAAQKNISKKETKPLTDEEIKYQEAKKEYLRTKV